MLMLYSLSRIARFAGETINVTPMDHDPSEAPEDGVDEQEQKEGQ